MPDTSDRTVIANVCTLSHLAMARCMVRSLRAHHPEADVWIAVVDGEAGRSPEFESATTVAGEEIVVATGYSGNLEFMDDGCSFLVDAREVAVHVPDGPYPRGSVWAEPDLDQAAAYLRSVVESPEEARRRGKAARERISRQLSPSVVGRIAEEALGV